MRQAVTQLVTLVNLCLLLLSGSLHARQLETILVQASATQSTQLSETQHWLRSADLESAAPNLASDIIQQLPSANLTTNSRGETLVNLRSAGERQTVIFFAGAPINVPWDNRFDLSSLPASVIESAATATGALSPRYGANALAAVALQPKTRLDHDIRLEVLGGSQGQTGINLLSQWANKNHTSIVGVSHFERDAIALSDDSRLTFYQEDDANRL
jgi:iron complex outermembrane receptor protein